MKKIILLMTALIFAGSTSLFAEIKVLKVKGTVAYKVKKDWVQLKEKQVLPEGVKISTGADSTAELSLNSLNHTITIKPFTVIQVYSKTDDKTSDTNVGLKRGKINVKVPKDKKVKTVFKVTTPIATSSVRGTEEEIFYGPDAGMIVKVIEGEIEGINRIERTRYITGKEVFVQKHGDGDPGFLLQDEKDGSIADVSDNSTTDNERGTGLYNNDRTGNPEGDTGILDNRMNGDMPATVDMRINWPE